MTNHNSEILNQFIAISKQVETVVKVVPSSSKEIYNALDSIIDFDKITVVSKFRFIDSELLNEYYLKNPNIKTAPTDYELSISTYGITDSFAGIAQTGSVCITNNNSMSGSYSLFPKVHIAILESNKIVARPRDIFHNNVFREITMNEDFIFVSGSSATADMGPLVRGVHGPGKLYVIILD